MQVKSANRNQVITPSSVMTAALRSQSLVGSASDIAEQLNIDEADVIGLAEDGYIKAIQLRSGKWLFPPVDQIDIWGSNGLAHSSSKKEPYVQLENFDKISEGSWTPADSLQSSELDEGLSTNFQSFHNEEPNIGAQSPNLAAKLNIADVCCQALLDEFIFSKKKRSAIPVTHDAMTGLKLEYTNKKRRLIVKAKARKRNDRCCLMEWSHDEEIASYKLESSIASYIEVFEKLKRRPTTDEFKLHSKKLHTVGDVLLNHLHVNVVYNHGEGSDEWNTIERLIRRHLSKDVKVMTPDKKSTQVINLMKEPFRAVTAADYSAYLNTFGDRVGVHDKIVSRIKAAFNFAVKERLIQGEYANAFTLAKRIDRDRHVEVSENDMKSIFNYLDDHPNQDFVFFMNLQSSGHFRDGQVMKLKFSDFDLAHGFVRVKPKRGKEVAIHLPKDIINMVIERQMQLKAEGVYADYMFPSNISETGHKANFDPYWYEMLDELEFFTTTNDGKKRYKYRLHDFRETLLGRLWECDDYTLASVLGHLSLHAIKSYRKANTKESKDAAEKGHIRKCES